MLCENICFSKLSRLIVSISQILLLCHVRFEIHLIKVRHNILISAGCDSLNKRVTEIPGK